MRRRDRAATWEEEAERDHFLTLSLGSSSFSRPLRSSLNVLLLSQAALMVPVQEAVCASCNSASCLCERQPAVVSPRCSLPLNIIPAAAAEVCSGGVFSA